MSSPVTMPPNWDPNRPWENVPQVRPPAPPPESFLDMLRRWVGMSQQGSPMTAQQPAPMPSTSPSPNPLSSMDLVDPLEMARRRAAAQSSPGIRALGEAASTIPLTTGNQAEALRR